MGPTVALFWPCLLPLGKDYMEPRRRSQNVQRIPESLAQVSFSSCVKFLDLSSWHCQTEGKSHLCVCFFFPFVLRPRACGQCSVKRLLLGRASGLAWMCWRCRTKPGSSRSVGKQWWRASLCFISLVCHSKKSRNSKFILGDYKGIVFKVREYSLLQFQ